MYLGRARGAEGRKEKGGNDDIQGAIQNAQDENEGSENSVEDAQDGPSLPALEDAVMNGSKANLNEDKREEDEADDLMGCFIISRL